MRRLPPRPAAGGGRRRRRGLGGGEVLTRRSAETTVDPESGELLEKVLVGLEEDHWSGDGAERLWAKPLGDDLYELRNTPWYAYDVNWGDKVRCKGVSEAGLPVVEEIVEPGGHHTLRFFFDPQTGAGDRRRVLEELEGLRALYENADDTLYSVDLEPGVEAEPVLDYLALEAEQGTLLWETGWTFEAES